MDKQNINNIHDKFFKSIMSSIEVARDFLKTFLPKEVLDTIDISTLKITSNSYVSEKLKETFADLVFKCKLKDSKHSAYISILLEHKSYPDKYAYIQILGYVVEGYQAQIKAGKPLEPIIPVLLYHGKQKWELKSLKDLIPYLPEDVEKYIPQFDIKFLDLKKFSDEELLNIGNSFLSSALTIQKYSHNPIELIKKAENIFGTLFPEGMGNFSKVLIVYYLQLVEIKDVQLLEIIEKIPPKVKKDFMSTYELIEKKGIEKGIEKGAERKTIDIIMSGHQNGFSIENLAIITGLSTEEVQKIIRENSN